MHKTLISTALALGLAAPSLALAEPESDRTTPTAAVGSRSSGTATAEAAVQRYVYAPETFYTVRCAPGRVTTLTLQPDEMILGPLEVGDSQRWVVGHARGDGWSRVAVKPAQGDLATNLTIHTDRRTYYLELRSEDAASAMANVKWSYPEPLASR